MNKIAKETTLFLTALMFYTRIPLPKGLSIAYSEDILNKSTKYFPIVGWLIGGIGAASYFLFELIFNHQLGILLSMATTILATGAFHEDGFADICDGFGGGWNKEKILEIMKDSRLGTYGTIGLVAMLAIKYLSLSFNLPENIPLILICGHSISRLTATSMIVISRYSRTDATSKVKPIGKKLFISEYLFAVILGFLPFLLLESYVFLTFAIISIGILLYFRWYFEKWIDGYTGDCLGAIQQVTEVCFYLFVFFMYSNQELII